MSFWDLVTAIGQMPSWLDRANQQTQRDISAYQTGGIPALMADTGEASDLAGGFGGTIRAHNPPPGVSLVPKTPSSIDAYQGGRNVGSINLAHDKPFVSSVFVEPYARNQGVGASLYSAAENLAGKELVPSPIGLSDDAKKFWRSELAAMPRPEAEALIKRAWDMGRSYGIKDADIATRLNDLIPGKVLGF